MGTFMGHFLPGSFFIIFAVWWAYSILIRYHRARYGKSRQPFVNLGTYPCSCSLFCRSGACANFPFEGLFKVLFCSIGLAGEIITALDSHGHFIHLGNGQHATMFSFFGVAGVIDFLMHYKFNLPKYTDYVFSAMCFAVEALLFMFHTHGRQPLDVALHTLLVYVVWCCVLAIFVEMKFPQYAIAGLSRSFFVCLQGTWFIQVGFILYPPFHGMQPWDQKNMEQIMIATIIFAWHMFFVFFAFALLSLSIGRCVGKGATPDPWREGDVPPHGFTKLRTTTREEEEGLLGGDMDDDEENTTSLADFSLHPNQGRVNGSSRPYANDGGKAFKEARLSLNTSS